MESLGGSGPPEWMRTSESSSADGARKRADEALKKPSSRLHFFADRRKAGPKPKAGTKTKLAQLLMSPSESEPIDVEFKDMRKRREDGGEFDQFRWATLYENQRGITIFSTPYYSSRSLLPYDPPPFTVPDAGESVPSKHANPTHPNVTLNTYPLPDPTWRWVSKSWLVDMRGDGDVQHDGFEYNWYFRRKNWRAHVGWFSAGGFVRRRRWVRLMMRPSDERLRAEAVLENCGHEDTTDEVELSGRQQAHDPVWQGNDYDWDRVRTTLKNLSRDGPKLEVWAEWLSGLISEDPPHPGKGKMKDESTGAITDSTTKVGQRSPRAHEHPPREWILPVLRHHGRELRTCFVYPDSRAQLCELFLKAKLVENAIPTNYMPGPYVEPPSSHPNRDIFNQFLGPNDFWSRSSELSQATIAMEC